MGDDFIIEWRALTVALFFLMLAPRVRAILGRSETEMPLACVLEGGTWAAGRVLAQRPARGLPPVNLSSDATVFDITCRGAACRDRSVAYRKRVAASRSFIPATTPSSRFRATANTMSKVTFVDHPLVQHKLTLMRRKDASTNSFRRLLNELAMLMTYEVTRDVGMQEIEIETPLETTKAKVIDGKKLVFVSILRAGTGILDGMLSVVPGARVGHIGLYRDPKTPDCRRVLLARCREHGRPRRGGRRPMLATGNSAIAAIERVKETRPKSIKFVCLLTCPRASRRCRRRTPDVPIFTAAIDRELNDHGYIPPGLGDAGDRIFGTK